MPGSGRNANHTDAQGETSNVVPFPGQRARGSSDVEAATPPAAGGAFQEILGAESFWDGDAAWLHQPMTESDPADPGPEPQTAQRLAEPTPDARAAAERPSVELGGESARPPMSRRKLLAWCGAVLAVLIVFGAVLPQLVAVRGHRQQPATLPLRTEHSHTLVGHGSAGAGKAAAGSHASRARARGSDRQKARHQRGKTHEHHRRSAAGRSTAGTVTPAAQAQTPSSDAGSSGSTYEGSSSAPTTATGGESSAGSSAGTTTAGSGSESGSSSATSGGSGSCGGAGITPLGCRGNVTP
jgi:hypothetical protein